MPRIYERKCNCCGKEYKGLGENFCSSECAKLYRRKNMKSVWGKTCEFCKKEFKVTYKFRSKRFCSKKCSGRHKVKLFTHTLAAKKRDYPSIRHCSKPEVKFKNIQRRAKDNGWACCSQEEFVSWYSNSEKKCIYCDIPLETWEKLFSGHQNKYSLSIDRKDNSLGYITNNLVLACSKCNVSKNDLFNEVEWKEIAQKYIKPKWQKMLMEESKCLDYKV